MGDDNGNGICLMVGIIIGSVVTNLSWYFFTHYQIVEVYK